MSEDWLAGFSPIPLDDESFHDLTAVLGPHLGFRFSANKQSLLAGRLANRVRILGLAGYAEYASILQRDENELQIAVDLVTTNETRFFREEDHFIFLEKELLPVLKRSGRSLRFWSAACSSGQEPYSLAMTLADALGEQTDWQVFASDISEKVLNKAREGLYPIDEVTLIPESKRKSYCLRGQYEYEGWFLIQRSLRDRVRFFALNLTMPLPAELSQFDVVFLRNVMIYFEQKHKDRLIAEVRCRLNPGGLLIVGLAETIQPAPPGFKLLKSSIYQRI